MIQGQFNSLIRVSRPPIAVVIGAWILWLALTPYARAADVTYSTLPGDDHGNTNGDFGQTFVAPAGGEVRLLNYSVALAAVSQATIQSAVFPVDPQTYVITGAPLWESDLRTVPPTGAVPNSVLLSFEPDELTLVPSATYALMVRQSGLGNTVQTGLGFRSQTGTDAYPDGSLRFISLQPYPYTGAPLHALTLNPARDLAFSAAFSVVPEPTSATMLIAVTLTSATFRRRSKRSGNRAGDIWK
jgi:hypothetical protein